MDYYVETNYYDHDKLMISSGKGRDDYFEMFRRCGLRRIEIRMFKHGEKMSIPQRLKVEAGLMREWDRALQHLGKGDTLFLSTPPSEKFTALYYVIKRVKERGCRIVIVVFDLEQFMTPYYRRFKYLKYSMSHRLESKLFELADVMMVHNEGMRAHIAGMGIDPDIMVTVGVMDYLCPDDPDEEDIIRRTGRDRNIVFCGNLIKGKAGFLGNVPKDLIIDTYGPNFEFSDRENIHYKGVLPPLRLMDELTGSFGLVWDGDSAETADGVCGEYLKCNNPHKMALYLASGLPVIVWDGSAMTDFVLHENCGVAVTSLSEIRSRTETMTDAEYAEMRKNAICIGAQMRRGEHIRAAVERVLQKLKQIENAVDPAADGLADDPGTCHAYNGNSASGQSSAIAEKGKNSAGNDAVSRNALIIFTREPEAGRTKTRLMPYFSPHECAELHRCMLRDIREELCSIDHGVSADIIVAYTSGEDTFTSAEDKAVNNTGITEGRDVEGGNAGCGEIPEFLSSLFAGTDRAVAGHFRSQEMFRKAVFIKQRGSDIGSKMENAVAETLAMGYDKVVLIGTDIPEIEAESIDAAFAMLDVSDVVIGPTEDGGYYLIGMKETHHEAFDVKLYGVSTVYEETAGAIRSAGLSVSIVDSYADIDIPEDIAGFRQRMREDPNLRKSWTGLYLMDKARISVMIPVYNEAQQIGSMIQQLRPYRDECEIIFVDGGSTDGTAEIICGKKESNSSVSDTEESAIAENDAETSTVSDTVDGAKSGLEIESGHDARPESDDETGCADPEMNFASADMVRTPDGFDYIKCEKGRGRQLNAGAMASSGDILFFLHCDSILPPDFPDEIRRVMARREWGCFGVKFPSRNLFMLTNRIISNHRAAFRSLPFGDQGIFIDRTLFFEAGMFPDQPVMEDYEFSLRVRRYTPAPGMTRKRIISSARRYGNGTLSILRTELCMWHLRHLYRKGVSTEKLQQYYRDIR